MSSLNPAGAGIDCPEEDCKRDAEVKSVMARKISVNEDVMPHREVSLWNLPTFVITNLVGDAVHNFVDGALIGPSSCMREDASDTAWR